jgi:FemAB family protein
MAPSVPPHYVRSLVRYYSAYVAERSAAYVDLSLVLHSNRSPAAVWPLAAHEDERGWHLTSGDGPLSPPLVCLPLPDKLMKRLVAEALELLDVVARRLGIEELTIAEWITSNHLGLFHQTLMDRGARVTATHSLGVDLSMTLDEIRVGFRKSFRPLVTKGLASWDADVVTSRAPEVFEEFRELHRTVAGKVTRGPETWSLQHDALAASEAFLVTLRDKSDRRLVGAGYFNISRTDAVYSVGAYDRSLFHLPLGHVVQYKAIEHMKVLGLKWYRLGARPYPADEPAPSAKEEQIALFKQGFATHLQPTFTLRFRPGERSRHAAVQETDA